MIFQKIIDYQPHFDKLQIDIYCNQVYNYDTYLHTYDSEVSI